MTLNKAWLSLVAIKELPLIRLFKVLLFSTIITFFLCGITFSEIDEDCIQIPGKYEVFVLSGQKAIDYAWKCKCRLYIDEEHHFIIFLDVPQGICT